MGRSHYSTTLTFPAGGIDNVFTHGDSHMATADYNVPTKANTKLTPWWEQLNAELAKKGLPEATYGAAKDYYECGYCPRTAVADIEATR